MYSTCFGLIATFRCKSCALEVTTVFVVFVFYIFLFYLFFLFFAFSLGCTHAYVKFKVSLVKVSYCGVWQS